MPTLPGSACDNPEAFEFVWRIAAFSPILRLHSERPMNESLGKETRRQFLEAGAIGFAGVALGASVPFIAKAGQRSDYKVFSEGRIGRVRARNRLIRAATAEGASPGGRMNAQGLRIYESLAKGGIGTIITGHIVAARNGDATVNQTHLDDDRYVAAARNMVEVVRRSDPRCVIIAQLTHGGTGAMVDPVAPSELPGRKVRVLSIREIQDIVAQFAAAAGRARAAGFDGVEFHGAHGYLLSSFLRAATNRRDDEYGGSCRQRAAIVRQIIAAARKHVGSDYPILIKMNANDDGEDEAAIPGFVEMASELQSTGIDALEISGLNAVRTPIDTPAQESYFLKFAERANVTVPIILTGGNRSIERMEGVIRKGKIDFFGLARPLVREPDLPARWLDGRGPDVSACISCNGCFAALTKEKRVTHCTQI
jgi:2,4-dienoyl-CoA reductase-like NADH-dependent reductase (Old Yellow Enzyme family)